MSREEESRLVFEYQAKWREESLSWAQFEEATTRQCEQVFDIADAAFATSKDSVALRLRGHLNYTVYHELFLPSGETDYFKSSVKLSGKLLAAVDR